MTVLNSNFQLRSLFDPIDLQGRAIKPSLTRSSFSRCNCHPRIEIARDSVVSESPVFLLSHRCMASALDFGHLRIKEMIRTLEANSRNSTVPLVDECLHSACVHLDPLNTPLDTPIRQRPLSQPCTRTETDALLTNHHHHHRQLGTTTDDAKLLSTSAHKRHASPASSTCLNASHRSDVSVRSITK